MSEITTCGEGIAAHAALHVRLASLLEALRRNFELHLTALDPDDPKAVPEIEAYTSLVDRHRSLSSQLTSTADEMASYKSLPMPEHDLEALNAPSAIDAFHDLIEQQDALASLLAAWVDEYRRMLEDEAD